MSTEGGTFGQWLWDELVDRDWNRSDLARRVGVEPSLVSRWVRDKATPRPATCHKIAGALGIGSDIVLDKAGHRPASNSEIDLSDPLVQISAANAHKLDESQKRALGDLIRSMARGEA